jgi:esterase/lipase
MLEPPASRPARDYAEGLERARAFMALDDASILPEARTALLDTGARAPLAVVLIHGFTNNPAQYSAFAPMLRERGVNVFIPRMPEHGDCDRMTTRLTHLTAEALIASTFEAIDVACGLGDRVGVLGISMGGALAAYAAQHRNVAIAVPVAPDFALLQMPLGVSRALAWLMRVAPNLFVWWDPRLKQALQPHTAYPRFPTHALGQTLRVGDEVYAAAKRERQAAERIVTVVNAADPAVNNEATQEISSDWSGWKSGGADYVVLRNLPEWHDIIDPRNHLARTDIVYPRLLAALGL